VRLTEEQIEKMDDESLIAAVEQDMVGHHLVNNVKFWLIISTVMIYVYFLVVKLPPYIKNFVYSWFGLVEQ
jgi:hypothetical protein